MIRPPWSASGSSCPACTLGVSKCFQRRSSLSFSEQDSARSSGSGDLPETLPCRPLWLDPNRPDSPNSSLGSDVWCLDLSFPNCFDRFGDPQRPAATNVVDPVNRAMLRYTLVSNKLALMLDLPKVIALIIKNPISKHSPLARFYPTLCRLPPHRLSLPPISYIHRCHHFTKQFAAPMRQTRKLRVGKIMAGSPTV